MPPSLFSSIAFIFFFFFFSSTARIEKPIRSSVLKKFHSKISKQVDDAVKPRPSSPEEAADDPAAAAAADDDAGAPAAEAPPAAASPKRRKKKQRREPLALSAELASGWAALSRDVASVEASSRPLAPGSPAPPPRFAFAEGALVKALRQGRWLLLDEINLAPSDVLERLACLLDGSSSVSEGDDGEGKSSGSSGWGGLLLSERGDSAPVAAAPGFRLLAAMNPATDAGKRDLPASLRSRFLELHVSEPSSAEDLRALVCAYLAPGLGGGGGAGGGQTSSTFPPAVAAVADAVVAFYRAARSAAASGALSDGGGHQPPYNLRTLCRSLEYAARAGPRYGLARALRDGVAAAFEAPLEPRSGAALAALADAHLPPVPAGRGAGARPAEPSPAGSHVAVGDYWLRAGPLLLNGGGGGGGSGDGDGGVGNGGGGDETSSPPFVVTPTVKRSLDALARAASLARYPVLLQGPTAAGKTSLVSHLAELTGHPCVRINNHDATDIADYLGSFRAREDGHLAFCEGPLLAAARRGHWVLLDELNLAPSDVLEALNRLLDGNGELYVPELAEVVSPAPGFALFATQNPGGGAYGGRKPLSRALRSRFLEVDVGSLPDVELADVVARRCGVPPSHASRLVAAQRALERARFAGSGDAFAGRAALVTPRDLLRWASRRAGTYAELAAAGFSLLGERLRERAEREAVAALISRELRVSPALDVVSDGGSRMYAEAGRRGELALARALAEAAADEGKDETILVVDPTSPAFALRSSLRGLAWTPTLVRAFALVDAAMAAAEPVLLIGDTGSGKTTACQLAAALRGLPLVTVSCSRFTEAADFVGGYRPVR